MSKLKTIDYAFLILCIMGVRSLIDANISQAAIVLCFTGLICFNKYMAHIKKHDVNEDLVRQIEDLRSSVSSVMIKNAAKPMMDTNRKIVF